MSGLRTGLLAVFCLSMLVEDVSAQPRGGIGNRDRGMLGRVGERRDERLNRNAPPPTAANPNTALNGAGNLGLNPNLPPNARAANSAAAALTPAARTPAANAAARAGIAPNLQASGYPNNSPYANRNAAPTPAPVPQSNMQYPGQRSAYYPESSNLNSLSIAPNNPLPSGVRPASASAPVNRLPYNGPGVLIRVPPTLPGEVNYLVDESEHLIVRSGEIQLLRLKGSYEVRFSRGVTSGGQSYGEARYTITEGVYRFDVSDNGWELYREGEARDVERAIAEAQKRDMGNVRQEESATIQTPPALMLRETPPATKPSLEVDRAEDAQPTLPLPSPTPPEETLPAPRSILEPS